MLRSKPQQWIPDLRFGYPPLRRVSKSFWEKLGNFPKSLFWVVSAPALYKNPLVIIEKAHRKTQEGPKIPCTKGGDKVRGRPGFLAGLRLPVPQILEFIAFGDPGKFFQQFSGPFSTEFPSEPPKTLSETATAFSSF